MIYGTCLCRNEANEDRWLYKYLDQMYEICDDIIFLDDNSIDDTIEEIKIKHSDYCLDNNISRKLQILKNNTCLWEENEVIARKKLFNEVIKQCRHGDWIINLDCDEIIPEEYINYLKHCFKYISQYPIENYDGLAFRLYDMWNNDCYRFDKWWTAHLRPWCMAIRYDKNREYKWKNTRLHCGRFPLNASFKCRDTLISIKHMGWSKEKFRIEKYNRYMELDGKRQDGIVEQYKSILDKDVNLIYFE